MLFAIEFVGLVVALALLAVVVFCEEDRFLPVAVRPAARLIKRWPIWGQETAIISLAIVAGALIAITLR